MGNEQQPGRAGDKNEIDPTVARELNLLRHTEAPGGHLQQQIVLAEELFYRAHPNEKLDLEDRLDRNKVMDYWGVSGYSDIFRKVRLHPKFPTHPKFRGDFATITLLVLTRYAEDPSLLEQELGGAL